MNINWNQYKAAGRNALSYAAGGVTAAAFMGIISQGDSTSLLAGLNNIASGLESVAKGIGMIAGVLVPLYTAYKAASSASPANQIKSVAATLSQPKTVQDANAIADPTARTTIINAVAQMPEVKGVVAIPTVAAAAPSDKVVATVAEIPKDPPQNSGGVAFPPPQGVVPRV